jgi:hypothetical protein
LPGIGGPQAGAGGAPQQQGPPPQAQPGGGGGMPPDQALALIRKYESRNRPNAGWGGKTDVDLSGSPLDATGFPDWKGNPGPKGISHAAGLYQFEPAEWRKYAGPLGVHDFSPDSQTQVAKAVYGKEGFAPWAPYNPSLAGAIKRGEDPRSGSPGQP